MSLVQDLLRGDELLDRALTVPNFTERDASDIICTLTKTVEYLHSQGVKMFVETFNTILLGISILVYTCKIRYVCLVLKIQ